MSCLGVCPRKISLELFKTILRASYLSVLNCCPPPRTIFSKCPVAFNSFPISMTRTLKYHGRKNNTTEELGDCEYVSITILLVASSRRNNNWPKLFSELRTLTPKSMISSQCPRSWSSVTGHHRDWYLVRLYYRDFWSKIYECKFYTGSASGHLVTGSSSCLEVSSEDEQSPTVTALVSTTQNPPTSCVPVSECPVCASTEPLRITCKRGRILISEMYADNLEATSGIFMADNTLKCRTKLYELHTWMLQNSTNASSREASVPVVVACKKGKITSSDDDPDSSEAPSLVYNGDGTRKCRDVVYHLQNWALEAGAIFHLWNSSFRFQSL